MSTTPTQSAESRLKLLSDLFKSGTISMVSTNVETMRLLQELSGKSGSAGPLLPQSVDGMIMHAEMHKPPVMPDMRKPEILILDDKGRVAQRGARVYDWIAGVDVDPDTTHHQGNGYRVPLALPALETYLGAQLDIRIAHAAGLEGLDVPQMLTALLRQKAGGDVRALLGVLPNLPPAWTVADGLRVVAREWKTRPKGGEVAVRQVATSPDDLNGIINLAIESGLSDPGRRDLLMAWLPAHTVGQLSILQRPTDQLRSDVLSLKGWTNEHGVPWLTVWLENAERLTDYRVGVPARFAAYRRSITP